MNLCDRLMSSSKMIVLKSSDGETFEVEEVVALESQTIKHMIEDNCADTSIPLPNVTSKILAKVIEYCKRHVDASKSSEVEKPSDDDLKNFDADFVKVDQGTLFDLILVRYSLFPLLYVLSLQIMPLILLIIAFSLFLVCDSLIFLDVNSLSDFEYD